MTNHKSSIINHQSLTIGWLYPILMNIYGDRGNIITISQRCNWRGIKTDVKYLNPGFSEKDLKECDILIMGGAQDKQQAIVNLDLKKKKNAFVEKIENGTPGLYVCGGLQFLGKYYKEADGTIIDGLDIFDLHTESPETDKKRLIGNIAIEANFNQSSIINHKSSIVIGFENHGGRTYLGKNIQPLGKVINGFGNNGEDKQEGAVYKNSFGTYLHGPILPKNPFFADYLIKKALELKYKTTVELKTLDDSLEDKARLAIAKRLSIAI